MFLIRISEADLRHYVAGSYDEGTEDGEADADVFVAHSGVVVLGGMLEGGSDLIQYRRATRWGDATQGWWMRVAGIRDGT
jgi:hypothetical protein